METDRSRIISYQRCPRERYLAYHHLGTGIQRTRKSLPLSFGAAFHQGTETLLRGMSIDGAVVDALTFLHGEFSDHAISFDNETPPDLAAAMAYGQEEQMALAEALLRAWYAYEGESFLKSFDVLEVEAEGRAQLADDLTLMFRPDALVKDRESGDCFVISWKTAATFGKRNTDQARHDAQSISEAWGLTQSRGVKIEGILYKFIVKGRRSLDKWDNLYKQNSHLVYGWAKLSTLDSEFPEWSWAYEYEDENGKTSRLGKGWQKKPIWRDYPGGVKQWVDDLSQSKVFPRHVDALAAVFPQAMPVERHEKDVEHWRNQVVAQEVDIAHKVQLQLSATRLPEGQTGFENYADLLDMNFPQYTSSCHSYSGCPFIPICWEGVKAEPNELYQIRLSNHPEGKGDEE